MKQYIKDSEKLYRAATKNDFHLISDGKVSAAFFIDSDGLSVDRDGNRSVDEIVKTFQYRFRKRGYINSVVLVAEDCRNADAYPVAKPTSNPYHAEIHDSKERIELTTLKAMALSDCCVVI